MASLKSLKLRIGSVKSTQKITKAMKMVAAAKLRRAQQNAEAGRPFSSRMADVVASLTSRVVVGPQSHKLIAGTGRDDTAGTERRRSGVHSGAQGHGRALADTEALSRVERTDR